MTRDEQAQKMVGQVATFYPRPETIVDGLAPDGLTRYIGQVISATPCEPKGVGLVPDFSLTIRGKTGKTATVSMFTNYVNLHPTWQAAQTYITK